MDECADLNAYNGDTVHNMNVDFDRYKNTSEPEYFENSDLDDFINNINDWD